MMTEQGNPKKTLTDAIKGLGCEYEMPKPEVEAFIVKGFASKVGLDAVEVQTQLWEDYPHHGKNEAIEWGRPQWVRGDHEALRYRGNPLAREKMWFQFGDPKTEGFRKYNYTGWQYEIQPATANVADAPVLDQFTQKVNNWLHEYDQKPTNHFIVTAYETQDHNIGMHSDKEKSIDLDSVIVVVKTGECGRPFRITDDKGETEFFNQVIQPGDAVIMSMDANLKTKHGVPKVTEKTGPSGSIVLRTIHEKVAWDELPEKLEKVRKDKAARNAQKKRALE